MLSKPEFGPKVDKKLGRSATKSDVKTAPFHKCKCCTSCANGGIFT